MRLANYLTFLLLLFITTLSREIKEQFFIKNKINLKIKFDSSVQNLFIEIQYEKTWRGVKNLSNSLNYKTSGGYSVWNDAKYWIIIYGNQEICKQYFINR